MVLGSRQRLGSYEILAPIGAGGMGEVYRARDTKLSRDVAIKILPEAFAQDEERLKRFDREAQVLAALNHPNIAAIYSLEPSFLVLELVEGPTLAERIAEGPMLPADAVVIARQIAVGLEAAHEKGIIHRDLKPANVKLTAEGDVKILDFGLAKALEGDAGNVEDSHSPTMTRAATQAGVLLGTAGYMSPEQARGKEVDKRADIWAFGVVLFEMLSGRRLFSGETVSDTLAAVLRQEIDWSALPEGTPRSLRALLGRCLERDPKERLRDIGEARIALGAPPDEPIVPQPTGTAPLWRRILPWASAAAAVVVALWAPWRSSRPAEPVRLSAELGADVSLTGNRLDVSADGANLVFVGQGEIGPPRLYVRTLDRLTATPLAGTEGADDPFFSPDGEWVAFFAGAKLKKVSVSGGAPVTLADAPNPRGGAWGEDGTILFTPESRAGVGLSRVSAIGGATDVVTTPLPEDDAATDRWPQFLPGGKTVLFTTHATLGNYENASLAVMALPDGPRKIVHRGGYYGRYVPSGHLIYVHEETLFAVPFDFETLEVEGGPVPFLEGVASAPASGSGGFAFSGHGTFAYIPGGSEGRVAPIHWMDRDGRTTILREEPTDWVDLAFSPDGRRLALSLHDGSQRDVWVYEWERDTFSRLTFDSGYDVQPTWTPDGQRILFVSSRESQGNDRFFWRRADGTGEAEPLTDGADDVSQGSFHPDGRRLVYSSRRPSTDADLMILSLEGDEASGWKPGKPTVFLASPFAERLPRFSPDGRWIAYMSEETGGFEIYVRPFEGSGGKWQISTEGGREPRWSRTRPELFYATADRIMVVPYRTEADSFRAEKPQLWSPGRIRGSRDGLGYDLHPDGDRFAVRAAPEVAETEERDRVVFLFNVFAELERVAPSGK